MKTYQVRVSDMNGGSSGTCAHCAKWSGVSVTFEAQRVALTSCPNHTMQVAKKLVEPYLRSNQRTFRIQLVKTRIVEHKDQVGWQEFRR